MSADPARAAAIEQSAVHSLLADAPSRNTYGGHFAMLPVELDCRPWRTRHPHPVTLPQARLEACLEQRLAERGVPVLRGHEVAAVEQDADGVTVGEIRGSHLVACDGGHSTVRAALGVPFPGRAGRMSAVAADLTLAARSDTVPTAFGHFSQYPRTAGGYFSILHPLDGDRHRLLRGPAGRGPAQPRGARLLVLGRLVLGEDGVQQVDLADVGEAVHRDLGQLPGRLPEVQGGADPGARLVRQHQPLAGADLLGHVGDHMAQRDHRPGRVPERQDRLRPHVLAR
ncbi:FAD-dependent monooxygenase [Streptomyces sp. NPDC005921]